MLEYLSQAVEAVPPAPDDSPAGWFDHTVFMVRSLCGPGWDPVLIAKHKWSDLAIYLAYLALSFEMLLALVLRARRCPVSRTLWTLGGLSFAFVLSCGIGHLLGYYMFSRPLYVLDGNWRVFTAVVSLGTAAAFPVLLRMFVRAPTTEEHEKVVAEAAFEAGRFDDGFRNSPIPMAIVSVEGRPTRVNSAFCQYLGYSEEELCSMTFPEFTHRDDIDLDVHQFERLMAREIGFYALRKRYHRKDRSVAYADLSVTPITEPGSDEIRHVWAIVRDVTKEVMEAQMVASQLITLQAELAALRTATTTRTQEAVDRADEEAKEAVQVLERALADLERHARDRIHDMRADADKGTTGEERPI